MVRKWLAEEGLKQLKDKASLHREAEGLQSKVATLQRATQKLQAEVATKVEVLGEMTEIIRDLKGQSSQLAA